MIATKFTTQLDIGVSFLLKRLACEVWRAL
jgi:hypothetical protein